MQDGAIADRLLEMAWAFTIAPESARDVHTSNALVNILQLYGNPLYFESYLDRCIVKLLSKHNCITSLHLLKTLVEFSGPDLKSKLIVHLQEKVCLLNLLAIRVPEAAGCAPKVMPGLLAQYKIHQLLVESLRDFVRKVASGGSALRPPGQGKYSYTEIVSSYLQTVEYFALNSQVCWLPPC